MANAMNDRLKDLLHKRNLSQRELAKLSGVTESSISHYLKGDRVPTSSTLTKLAETLGTTPDYLLFGKPFTEIDQLNSSIETVKRCAAYLSHAQKLELISALVDKDKND